MRREDLGILIVCAVVRSDKDDGEITRGAFLRSNVIIRELDEVDVGDVGKLYIHEASSEFLSSLESLRPKYVNSISRTQHPVLLISIVDYS